MAGKRYSVVVVEVVVVVVVNDDFHLLFPRHYIPSEDTRTTTTDFSSSTVAAAKLIFTYPREIFLYIFRFRFFFDEFFLSLIPLPLSSHRLVCA